MTDISPIVVIAGVTLVLTVAIQFGGIIWFAAMTKASINAQNTVITKLEDIAESLNHFVHTLDRRVSILEDRQGRGVHTRLRASDEVGMRHD